MIQLCCSCNNISPSELCQVHKNVSNIPMLTHHVEKLNFQWTIRRLKISVEWFKKHPLSRHKTVFYLAESSRMSHLLGILFTIQHSKCHLRWQCSHCTVQYIISVLSMFSDSICCLNSNFPSYQFMIVYNSKCSVW